MTPATLETPRKPAKVAQETPPSVPTSPVRRRKPAARWNALLRLLRRIHLYSGLFMFPWVMLYGTTAYLFNHPRAFTTSPAQEFDFRQLAGTPLASLPAASALATQVVAAIEDREREMGRDTAITLDAASVRFGRGQPA